MDEIAVPLVRADGGRVVVVASAGAARTIYPDSSDPPCLVIDGDTIQVLIEPGGAW